MKFTIGRRNNPTDSWQIEELNRGIRPGSCRKSRRRAVLKTGHCNIIERKSERQRLRFLQDIFTTLLDSQWRWTLLVFSLGFILSWFWFAIIWWLIAHTHGDFEEDHLPPNQSESKWTPCVYNIYSFTSCFLFSIETQHTIGYGVRMTTEQCPEAIFVMCFQSITGVMVQAFMVGIIFAKMTRPKRRTQTLLFSKNGVVCQRNNELVLMFRIGDIRKSHIIGATVRAQLIKNRQTREGEILAQNQTNLSVQSDKCNSTDLLFIWPMIIMHRINAESPFYNLTATDLLQEKFEIVLILEGTVESTGQSTQARSSYLNSEIMWGHRFLSLVNYNKDQQIYEIDYSKFDETIQVDTPLCSGRQLSELWKIAVNGQSNFGNKPIYSDQNSPALQQKRLPLLSSNTDCLTKKKRKKSHSNASIIRSKSQTSDVFNRHRNYDHHLLSDSDSDSVKTHPGLSIV